MSAGVDVNAVAVCVDFYIVDCKIINPSCQDRKVAAVEDRNVADDDVSAEFEADGFVTPAVFDRVYDTKTYTTLKKKYDPQGLLPTLFDKVVKP